MMRFFRSPRQTLFIAMCVLALNLSGFDIAAQAQPPQGISALQSSHYQSRTKRRRSRRRAKSSRQTTAPSSVTTTTTQVPPAPRVGGVVYGSRDSDNASETVPPPTQQPNTVRQPGRPINGGVLNGRAISLPKPAYPPIARAARASGTVVVQVIIDETGKVMSARAISGHPLLQAAAVQAAYGARFSPTTLSGQPVKVAGTISYNFIP